MCVCVCWKEGRIEGWKDYYLCVSLKKYLPIFNWSFELPHPASASYAHTEWETEGVFGKIKKILQENHNVTIEWLHDDMPF